MKRIEHYSDYRIYLRDYYEEQKRKFPFFSHRYICRKAGMKSPSFLREIIAGKRNMTSRTISAFAKVLALNENDAKFFELLIKFNQSKNSLIKQQFLEQLRGLTPKVKQNIVPVDHYSYYSRWYNPVIRELACTFDWEDDFGLLARSVEPSIKKSEARESVKLLLELKFLIKSEDGKYKQNHPSITTGSEVSSIGVRASNRLFSAMGTEAIDRFSPDERDISCITMGISSKGYKLFKQEIREFKDRLIRIANDDKETDRVYNINLQLFPLSAKTIKGTTTDE